MITFKILLKNLILSFWEWAEKPKETAGTFITDGKTFARIACSDGYLVLNDIQWEGKKRMPITDFLRGYRSPN